MTSRSLPFLFVLFFALPIASAADRTWKGWITDSHCGVAGAHPGDTACAKSCVKKGAKFVLVEDSTKKIYTLDPQDQVEPHAGGHVLITGTLEGHVLKFTKIEPAE